MSDYVSPALLEIVDLLRQNTLSKNRHLVAQALTNSVNIDPLIHIGITCAQSNRLADALLVFECLQSSLGGDIRVAYNLGLIHSMLGNNQKALEAYDLALLIDSNDLDTLVNKGAICNELKEHSLALQSLNRALEIKSSSPEALSNKGVALTNLGLFEEAVIAYDESLRLNPSYFEVWSNKSLPLSRLGRYAEALASCDTALKIQPDYIKAHSNAGFILLELKRYEEALTAYENALSIDPNNAEFLLMKGTILHELNFFDKAISCFDRVIEVGGDYSEAYCNKGACLYRLQNYEEALSAFDDALSRDPKNAEAHSYKGKTLQALKLYEAALASNEEALRLNPDLADVHLDIAFLHFRMLNFKAGWESYEWRWLARQETSACLNSSKPIWNGGSTKERVLVRAEQGVGDQILYSSMLDEMSHLAPKVLVSIDKRMLALYERSFPQLEFMDEANEVPEDSYDTQISLASLPKYLRTDKEDFRHSRFPYLRDDQAKTEKIRVQLKEFSEGKPVCGIAWRSINKDLGDYKSIPIAKLFPVLNIEKFEFVNLQYGDVDSEIKGVKDGIGKIIYQVPEIDLFDDFDSSASLIGACDLIVTSSNTTAHLAGALNKNTILILPFEAGKFWYWHEENGCSICYPSIKVFSQSRQGSWDEVIREVRLYMEKLSFE